MSPGVSIRPREARMLGFLVLRRHKLTMCNAKGGLKVIFEKTYSRNHPQIISESKGPWHLRITEVSLQSYGSYDARPHVLPRQPLTKGHVRVDT